MHTPLQQPEHVTERYVAHGRSFSIDISNTNPSSVPPAYGVRVTEQGAEVVMGELAQVVAPAPDEALKQARDLIDASLKFERICRAFLSYLRAYEDFVETREATEFDALKAAHQAFIGLTAQSEVSAQLSRLVAAISARRQQSQTGPVDAQQELVEAARHFRTLGAWLSDEGQRFPGTFWSLVERARPARGKSAYRRFGESSGGDSDLHSAA